MGCGETYTHSLVVKMFHFWLGRETHGARPDAETTSSSLKFEVKIKLAIRRLTKWHASERNFDSTIFSVLFGMQWKCGSQWLQM